MNRTSRNSSKPRGSQANARLPLDHPVIIAFSASRGGVKAASAEQSLKGVIKRRATYFQGENVGDLDCESEAGQRITFAIAISDAPEREQDWVFIDELISGPLALLREGDRVKVSRSGPADLVGRKAWTIDSSWDYGCVRPCLAE